MGQLLPRNRGNSRHEFGYLRQVTAAEAAQRMLTGNPNAALAGVPDYGHSITLDNPAGLLDVVSSWLASA
jgi:hypothetical protein